MYWVILIGLAALAHFQISGIVRHWKQLLEGFIEELMGLSSSLLWLKVKDKLISPWWPKAKLVSFQLWQEAVLQGTWEELERLSENEGLVHCLWKTETEEVKRALGDWAMRDFSEQSSSLLRQRRCPFTSLELSLHHPPSHPCCDTKQWDAVRLLPPASSLLLLSSLRKRLIDKMGAGGTFSHPRVSPVSLGCYQILLIE